MAELLPQIIFGWPFIIASLILSIMGVAARSSKFLVAGAMFFMPPSLYLSGFPAIRWLAYLLPFCILGSAYFIGKNRSWISWLLLLPPISVSLWLAYLVMEQARNF